MSHAHLTLQRTGGFGGEPARFPCAGGGAPPSELSAHFPPLLWLLRDFVVDLSSGGERISEQQYMENALAERPSSARRADERNSIRRALRELFPNRTCRTLVRCASFSAESDPPSSVISHQSSVIRHPSSVIRPPSSVIRHPSSVISHSSSVINYQSSVISHRSSLAPLSLIPLRMPPSQRTSSPAV